MVNFIKLTSLIINTSKITTIIIKNNRYCIYLNNFDISGFLYNTHGHISSNNEKLEICQTANPEDYKIITNWINNINPIKKPYLKLNV